MSCQSQEPVHTHKACPPIQHQCAPKEGGLVEPTMIRKHFIIPKFLELIQLLPNNRVRFTPRMSQ